MRTLAAILLIAGCTSSPQQAAEFNTCVDEKAHIGYRLKNHNTGQIGTVTKIYGRSDRCSDPGHPVLSSVRYE